LAARFSTVGKRLVSAAFDGTLRIWDVAALKEVQKIEIGREFVTLFALSPDGKTIALGAVHGRIRLLDLKTGKDREVGPRLPPSLAVGFAAGGRSLLTLDARTAREWNTATGKEIRKAEYATDKDQGFVRLLAEAGQIVQARQGQPIRLIDARTGKEVRALEGKLERLMPLALAPDGRTLAVVASEGNPDEGGAFVVRLWDIASGKEFQQFPGRPSPIASLALSPDGRMVAGTEGDGVYRVWESTTARERRRLTITSRAPRTMDWEGMEMRRMMFARMRMNDDEGGETPSTMLFTPDGKEIAITEGETIRICDLATGRIIRRFAGDATTAGAFAFSPDGRLFAASGPDATVWLWNNGTTELLGRLPGHRASVQRLVFSADGKTLVSTSEDGTALVWNVDAAIAAARQSPGGDVAEQRFAALWTDLADTDAGRAYSAIRKLSAAPLSAMKLFKTHLRPAAAVDPQHVAKLVADLDDAEFQVRQKATDELEQIHELAAPALAKALAAKPSLEAQRRLEGLQQKIQRRQLPVERVRCLRVIEVLESIPSGEAHQLLLTLAGGVAESQQTKEAKAALSRRQKLASLPN
jgi:WD40 repeat protein